LSVSEYAQTILGLTTDELIESGEVPAIDLNLEKLVQQTCLKLADEFLLESAHDCSDGGLAVAIAESCFSSLNRKATGAEINLKSENLSNETVLFSESPSRIVVSFAAGNLERIKAIVRETNCPFAVIGKVGGAYLKIKINDLEIVSATITELETVWGNSLQSRLEN
jgi:phosphoribosylformylglycinamidine synthase